MCVLPVHEKSAQMIRARRIVQTNNTTLSNPPPRNQPPRNKTENQAHLPRRWCRTRSVLLLFYAGTLSTLLHCVSKKASHRFWL